MHRDRLAECRNFRERASAWLCPYRRSLHIPGVSNFGGYFGAYLKYAGFDALEISGIAEKDVMIVIDSFQGDVSIIDAPAIDQVFDLEHAIIEQFMQAGHEKKNIVFLTTGVGAATTNYGCINSHYFDAAKPAHGTKGLFRTKQAGRTGLGTIMMHKNIRAVVVLAHFPHGDNPYGAADWDKVKQAGSKLHKIVKEVDPAISPDAPQRFGRPDLFHE